MEVKARELMERQSLRLGEYPEVQARVSAHLKDAGSQLRRLAQCLASCGDNTSSLKDTAQSITANLMSLAYAMAGDEILKNTFASNAFEHFEIAAYESLLALCEKAGIDLSAPLLASLREEEQMAAWIDGHLRDHAPVFGAGGACRGLRQRPRKRKACRSYSAGDVRLNDSSGTLEYEEPALEFVVAFESLVLDSR